MRPRTPMRSRSRRRCRTSLGARIELEGSLRAGPRVMNSFMRQQPALAFDPSAEAGQRSVGANDSMARHDDRYGITSIGQAHRTRRVGFIDMPCQTAVAPRLAVADLGQHLPHSALKIGALHAQRQVKCAAYAFEVLLELAASFGQGTRARIFDAVTGGHA